MLDIPVPHKKAVTMKRYISNRKSGDREFPVGLWRNILVSINKMEGQRNRN